MKTMMVALLAVASVAAAPRPKASIVLVHGAFADGSSWAKVIPILERDGYEVSAVQIPLTSLPEDVATAKRVIDAQKGPVVASSRSSTSPHLRRMRASPLPPPRPSSLRRRRINPDLERFYAKRANARTTELMSSHVAFLSRPRDVAKVIEEAAP